MSLTASVNLTEWSQPAPEESGAAPLAQALPSAGVRAEDLAGRCQGGCQESFPELMSLYEERIYNYLNRFLGNSHDAEDVTQETFLKAYRNIHRFNTACSFTTWLFTIAKRTALNHIRSARRSPVMDPDNAPELSDDRTPSDDLEARESGSQLWRVVSGLKQAQREALWLRYAEGFNIAETARIMNLNPVYVKVLLHRGRQALSRKIKTPFAS